jgi:HK97 family phage major capsid protein
MADEEKKVDEGQRTLEVMTTSLKGMADNVEGMEARLKAQYGKDLTAAQEEMDAKVKKAEAQMEERLRAMNKPATAVAEPDEFYGYGKDGLEDVLAEVRAAPEKPGMGAPARLLKMHTGELERRDLTTLSGGDGGYMLTPQYSSQLLTVPDDSQFIADRCRNIPAGDPPNAEMIFNAFDQTGSKGVYGGVAVYSGKEAANVTNLTTPKLLQVALKPEKMGAYWIVTEESTANTPQMGALMQPLVQGAIASYRDDKIQNGTGAGEFLGFAGCSAQLSIARKTANEINYIDTVNMLARVLTAGSGNYVWLCQRVGLLPQLMTMTNGAGQLIWSENARDGIPAPRLQGVPVFFNEISPALGTAGDLCLVNLDYYLRKQGMGAQLKSDNAMSNFLSGKETIKVTWYEDGKTWLTQPITLRDGTNTVSPFISLAA